MWVLGTKLGSLERAANLWASPSAPVFSVAGVWGSGSLTVYLWVGSHVTSFLFLTCKHPPPRKMKGWTEWFPSRLLTHMVTSAWNGKPAAQIAFSQAVLSVELTGAPSPDLLKLCLWDLASVSPGEFTSKWWLAFQGQLINIDNPTTKQKPCSFALEMAGNNIVPMLVIKQNRKAIQLNRHSFFIYLESWCLREAG